MNSSMAKTPSLFRDSPREVGAYLENISLSLLGLFFLTFPALFTTATTEPFVLPKQVLLAVTLLALLVTLGVKMISDGKVRLRRTPFDVPLLLLALTVLVSSFFALNRYDSFLATIPFLFAMLAYFLIVNIATSPYQRFLIATSFVAGVTLAAVIGLLSFYKLYIFPFALTKTPNFNPFGALLDHSLSLAFALPVAASFFLSSYRIRKNTLPRTKQTASQSSFFKKLLAPFIAIRRFVIHIAAFLRPSPVFFGLATLVLVVDLALSIYQLATGQKPILLPFATGFQTAFAAISQDAKRMLQAVLFGSGFGTYVTDFTRFKQPFFNLHPTLWSFTFFRSSSFLLELLATTGLLGFGSFLFLLARAVKTGLAKNGLRSQNPFLLSLLFAITASLFLPFSFTMQATFFLLLSLFASFAGTNEVRDSRFFEVELQLVALKKGLLAFSKAAPAKERSLTTLLPVSFLITSIVLSSVSIFYIVRYVASDVLFQKSLIAASKNSGLETYNNQVNAIQLFPYRDAYYRIYSQTNLALANSLLTSLPKDSSPSAQTQTTVYTLIQQSIESARRATTLGPASSINWQNLSSIYRSLIGVGRNAENFAIFTAQQAVLLDPNNPQLYISLGGLYYQFRQWDNAQRQFQIAVSLKPDFANAYYNLGHALEGKGNLQEALAQYQTVKSLIANADDKQNLKKITAEIEGLEKKIGTASNAASRSASLPRVTTKEQPPLEISTPSATLPGRQPKVDLPQPRSATESGI